MATPEGFVKNRILSHMKLYYRVVKVWINDSVGIFDQKKGTYRANKSPYRIKGRPDIEGILPGGRYLGIEVKVPEQRSPDGKRIMRRKGMPSPEQLSFIEMANEQGGLCFIARSPEDVDRHLSQYRTSGVLSGGRLNARGVDRAEVAEDPRQTRLEDFIEPSQNSDETAKESE